MHFISAYGERLQEEQNRKRDEERKRLQERGCDR